MTYEQATGQYVVFRLGLEEFAFDISKVKEIFPTQEITKVHRSPTHIEGVINLRGRLVTVIDLRRRFKLEAKSLDESSRIIVVEASDAPVGFTVDEVAEVVWIPVISIEPVPGYVAQEIESEYVAGIAKLDDRLITIIDPLKILDLSTDDAGQEGGISDGDRSGG